MFGHRPDSRDRDRRKRIIPDRYVTDTVGLPTLRDILEELAKPGRDPRRQFENVAFSEGIEKNRRSEAGDEAGRALSPTSTAFGAFVDIGVHQDGLVHLSELASGYVKGPAGMS